MTPARPDMPVEGTGRCFCGRVRFAWSDTPLWAAHCHCESCRRHCSAPFTSFFGVADGAWQWTGAEPALYQSSSGVRRYFCPSCASPMAYAAERFPGETHFYAASMDEPERFVPTFHTHADERLSWIHLADGLPRYKGPSE